MIFQPSVAPSFFGTPLAEQATSPGILIAAACEQRLQLLNRQVRALLPRSRISTTADPVDAVLWALRPCADLVLVDRRMAGGRATALVCGLARMAPAATVIVFDEDDAPRSATNPHVPWSQAGAAIAQWRDRQHAARLRKEST